MGAKVDQLKWRWRYRTYIRRENRYIDFETNRPMYRGAPYCLNCKTPVMNYGSFCPNCKNQDSMLPSVPEPPSAEANAAAWNKVDRYSEEREKNNAT